MRNKMRDLKRYAIVHNDGIRFVDRKTLQMERKSMQKRRIVRAYENGVSPEDVVSHGG